MRGFALTLGACLFVLSGTAKAAPRCDSVDASIGFEKVVKSGETSTYFSPHMNIGGSDARYAVLTVVDGAAICKALGHKNGNLGSFSHAVNGDFVITLNSNGQVGNIKRACEGDNCAMIADTVTCW
jgi:hypothetical protein